MNNRLATTAAAMILAALRVGAQTPQNHWLDSDNPAGIRQDTTVERSAAAEIYSGMEAGGYRQTWEAALPWKAGARVYSIVHLKRMSMEGSFRFEQMGGNGMCGSMLLEPEYWPVDVLEFTPGRKSRQTYAFTGAFSTDLSDGWRIGGALDFESSNYSKRKDLRYTNYCLDVTAAPGVVWHRDDLSLGFNLIIGKKSETPVAKQIGTKDTFYAFLDKGLMFGTYELWDGSGVHLSDAGVNGFPLREVSAGAGIQMQKGRFYASADYRYTSGRAGEKQQVWFRFPSHTVSVDLGYSFKASDYLHSFRAQADWKSLVNSETVLERYTEGGVTNYREISSRPILGSQTAGAELAYECEGEGNVISAELSCEGKDLYMSQMYPYIYERRFAAACIEAAYRRSLGRFVLGASVLYADGLVREHSSSVDSESGVTGELYRLTEWEDMSLEYMAASRIGCRLLGKVSFWKGLFVKIDLGYVHAFGIEMLSGADRFKGELSFGYEF